MSPISAEEKRALIEMGLRLIERVDERSKVFGDLNKKLYEMCGEFGPRLAESVDDEVWSAFIALMNRLMTGATGKDNDLASYWESEARHMKDGAHIYWTSDTGHSKTKWPFNTIEDVLAYIEARDKDDARWSKSSRKATA